MQAGTWSPSTPVWTMTPMIFSKPTANATFPVMSAVNAVVQAGKTPLTQGIEEAAEALDFRSKPGVIIVLTDGE